MLHGRTSGPPGWIADLGASTVAATLDYDIPLEQRLSHQFQLVVGQRRPVPGRRANNCLAEEYPQQSERGYDARSLA
jgi:hypothetical protein